MRKMLFMFSLLLMLTVVAIAPAAAQESGNIVDVVSASATGEEPEFALLLAALQAADPIFLEILSDPEADVTVFAPTDEAFLEAFDALNVSLDGIDPLLLNDILSYHVLPGLFPAETFNALNGAYVGTYLNGRSINVTVEDETVMVNEAEVVTADQFVSNGIIHVVDSVLVPDPIEVLLPATLGRSADPISVLVTQAATAEIPQFTTLLAAIQAADPAILTALAEDGPYTVFAPTDEAFEAALLELDMTAEELLSDTVLLNDILRYHVLPGEFGTAALLRLSGGMGESINIATLLRGVSLDMSVNAALMVSYAEVELADLRATNGVIHVIDSVLIPPL